MNRLFIAAFAVFAMLTAPSASFAEKQVAPAPPAQWKKTITTLKKLNHGHAKDVGASLQLSKKDKQQLTSQLKQLRTDVTKTDNEVTNLIARYNELIKKEAELTKQLQSRKEEIKTFEGTVRTAAKLLQDRAQTSYFTQQNPQRLSAFSTLLAPDRMPGLADLTKLIEMYFEEVAATASVTRYNSKIIGTDGELTDAEIIRAGTSSAIYKTAAGDVGFLQPAGDEALFKGVNGISSGLTDTITTAFTEGSIMPLDFSHGAAFIRFVAEKDIWSKIADGGVLVWPILGIGAIALLLAFERFFSLSRFRRSSPKELSEFFEYANKRDWESCYNTLKRHNTPTGRVLWATLKKEKGSSAALEKAMQEALLKELAKMERFLPTMQTLAAVAPLLGLLGTVTGMINTFQIITLFGTGDPHMLSGGISEALVTTQLGLAVAIPIMMLHHILNSRVDRLAGDMEEKGTALIATILNRR